MHAVWETNSLIYMIRTADFVPSGSWTMGKLGKYGRSILMAVNHFSLHNHNPSWSIDKALPMVTKHDA